MKTLILIRHAKSDWPENVEDFDRPLTELGMSNAPKMANLMLSKNISIDQFITSPAKRALHTCQLMAEVFGKGYIIENKLYNPREVNFENTIYGLPNELKTVALFSHNNGISNFANMLTNEIINLPTCGIVGYEIECDNWIDFECAKKKFMFLYSPKNL